MTRPATTTYTRAASTNINHHTSGDPRRLRPVVVEHRGRPVAAATNVASTKHHRRPHRRTSSAAHERLQNDGPTGPEKSPVASM